MSAQVTPRWEYFAYPHQLAFHHSRAKHRLLGGAAGPGKTFALLADHFLSCNSFSAQDAPQVHTLLLRRTHPKLEATVITRFREKFPRDLYRDYNEQKHVVTWRNGSSTQFGAMQYEHDVWGWQGQWYKIGYDELTEFTFPQWQNISAWNRCPVSKHCTKDGATNPVGVGAQWVEDLFISKRPCAEMDAGQRAQYNAAEHEYFPATYLDNPVYAKDENWIRGLDSYQSAMRDALKLGKWGVAGGYFDGAWDEPYNVYPAESVIIRPHWRKWLGGDWGFEHNSAIYWNCLDDDRIVRVYRELVCNHHTPEELGERIAKLSFDENGKLEQNIEFFSFSHDAFAQKHDTNPVGNRVGNVLATYGLPRPHASTRDAMGREQLLYGKLKSRVKVGEVFNDAENRSEPILAAGLQIADTCKELIRVIPKAPRDEEDRERIAEFLGDDPLQGEGYALYDFFGPPNKKPTAERVEERVEAVRKQRAEQGVTLDPTAVAMISQKAAQAETRKVSLVPLSSHRRFGRMRPRY